MSISASSPSHSNNNSRFLGRLVIYGLLVIFAILYLMPLFVMLTTSFKTMDEIQGGNMLALPEAPTFDPWIKAWGEACVGLTCAGIKGYFWNSIKMVVPAVAISTIMGALNGYILTKWRFPGHTLVFGCRLRLGLHHAVLPQFLRGVPDRAGARRPGRRRQLLPDLPPHHAAELAADHRRHRHLPVHQYLERLPVCLGLCRHR
ncbi:putative sugar ABC transporter, permease protein [Rhizobium etli CIAT 652]|uniref:Putative sugar ABC transporter, permease protein n=1 Tax=Rhizobium etli (strain CIAT 652) TaxID=491916 RepID=B3Q0X7_RHIE6|nr:putative sugar ABC transporter, permease protein [Rhizobium etli CIAT 652]